VIARASTASNGWVAQLAEQRTENPRVGGSIPPPAISIFSPVRLVLPAIRIGAGFWKSGSQETGKSGWFPILSWPPGFQISSLSSSALST
jgi:hypothetical protein